jgi:Sel1 repeat
MSIDYAFWKWRGRARISRGLCYLLVVEGAEVPEVELLDVDRYRELISKRFPSWEAEDDSLPIYIRLLPTGIFLQTYASTPTEVLQWFIDLSEADSLQFFDPQSEAISEQDKRDFHARLKAIEQTETAAQWQNDLNHLLARAEVSDQKALVDLGNRYSFGEGVQQDLARAFGLYLRAAEAGSEDGMFNVAACYRLGEGVEENLLKAAEWYERALVKDKFFAPFALGMLYSTPGGLPPDNEKAIVHFQIALAPGHQDARRELRRLGALPPLPPPSKRTDA